MTRVSVIGALIVGDEILTGRRQDSHLQHCIQVLGERGLELSWVRYLGDDEDRLVQTFEAIREAGDLCFSFGGIGATPDDRTRQAMARAHKVSLYRHPDAVREIEQRYGAEAYPKRILMAEFPRGSHAIPNPYNRIPGFSMGHIYCLPGFPEMAWPMMQWILDECYPQLVAEKPLQVRLLIRETRESELIDPMQRMQVLHPRVKVSSLPRFLDGGGYQVEMGLRGQREQTESATRTLCEFLNEQGIVFEHLD